MSVSERVTWVTCPSCGSSAAVGWRDGDLVEVDCPGGCRLTSSDFAGRGPNGLTCPPPVAARSTGDGTSRSGAHPTPQGPLPDWSVPA
jgi:hypothetical protein